MDLIFQMALRGFFCEKLFYSCLRAQRLLMSNHLCPVNSLRFISSSQPSFNKKEYEVTFIKACGERIKGKGKEGDSLLDVVVNNDLDFDGYGACEGTLTCSTCHVVLKKEDYERLPDKPSEEENDMLDLAYGLTDTSRLGCQIILSKELDGLEVHLPETINDARS